MDILDTLDTLGITKEQLVSSLIGASVGSCAAVVTKTAMDAVIPKAGNPLVDITLGIGKWGIAYVVADQVTNHVAEPILMSMKVAKAVEDLRNAVSNGTYVECDVEEV